MLEGEFVTGAINKLQILELLLGTPWKVVPDVNNYYPDCETGGSHGNKDSSCGLLGCDTM
jgi:hypothetical protein